MMNVLAAWGTRSDAILNAITQKIAYTAQAHEQSRNILTPPPFFFSGIPVTLSTGESGLRPKTGGTKGYTQDIRHRPRV
jgi:hypothetical protein